MDKRVVRFIVRTGKWVLAAGFSIIVGLAITFSPDPALDAWGWHILGLGAMIVFLLMDFMVARLAVWSWRQSGYLAYSLVLVFFVILTASVGIALYLDNPVVSLGLFYLAVPIGLVSPFVQAYQQKRQRPT